MKTVPFLKDRNKNSPVNNYLSTTNNRIITLHFGRDMADEVRITSVIVFRSVVSKHGFYKYPQLKGCVREFEHGTWNYSDTASLGA